MAQLDVRNHPHPDPVPEYRARGKHAAALLGIVLLATAVRFHDIARHPLWLDEFLALGHSAGQGHVGFFAPQRLATSGVHNPPPDVVGRWGFAPYSRIWQGMAEDVHPPLYPVVLRVWRDALKRTIGDRDATVRALGALFGVLGVALLWDAVRLLHGPGPALWAALIMALAAPQIQWAQDARPYTLVTALALGAIDAVVRLERYGPGALRAAALGLCTFAAALTHYYALPPLFALGCYAALRLRGRARVQGGVAMLGGVVLFGALWGATFIDQVRGGDVHATYLIDDAPGHVGRTLLRLALLPARSLNEPSPRVAAIAALGAILYVLPLLLRRRRPDLLLWGGWIAAAVAPALVLDLLKRWEQLDLLRYTSLAMPGFYALMAAVVGGGGGALAERRRWLRHAVPAVAALSCLVSLPRTYAEPQSPKADYPWLARNLAQHVQPGDALVFYNTSEHGSPVLWYMAMSWYVPPDKLPRTIVFLMDEPTPAAAEALHSASNVWTISPSSADLPHAVTASRTRAHTAAGFNLPLLQQWTPSSPEK